MKAMKVRRQTLSLDLYLQMMESEKIRSDQECQRRSEQWTSSMVNELIATVLSDGYIPPVILGEETVNGITKQWSIDGLQRSTSLLMFKYTNTKITKSLEEYLVTYQKKVLDENGQPKRDDKGELIWESVEYDIRNKTYEQLPKELQDRFNGYQMETAVHQDCDMSELSKLVRKYNNHKAMNQAQKAFTYADVFAGEIRRIIENHFFLDVYTCSRNDRKNGTLERIVGDMVLLCCYPDMFRKDVKKGFKWLNENASLHDFESLDTLLVRLKDSVEPSAEIRALFTSKNAHIFVAAFKTFVESGHKDKEFGGFLHWFVKDGKKTEINGSTWETLDASHSTRDTATVRGKLDYLVALVKGYIEESRKAA